jgi:hypothetical protein
VYYQYKYTKDTNGTDFDVTATGNLDASGGNSVWTLEGGLLTGTDGKTAMRLAPNFLEPTDPEE